MHLKGNQFAPKSPRLLMKKNTLIQSQNKLNTSKLYPKTERYNIDILNINDKKRFFQPRLLPQQSMKQSNKCPSFILQLQKKKNKVNATTNISIVSKKLSPVKIIPNSSKNAKIKDVFQVRSVGQQRLVNPQQDCLFKKKKGNLKNNNLQASETMEVMTIASSQQDQQLKNDQFFLEANIKSMPVKHYKKTSSLKQIIIKKKRPTLCLENFKIIKKIGKGSYGEVFLVQDINTNALFALKKICKTKLKSTNERQQAIRQIKIQSYLQSEVISPLYGWFSDDFYIYLILEYFQSGTLTDLLSKKGKLTQLQTINYIKQICKAINIIHNEKIIHRDLKTQNIFLHSITAKIGDFGCSIYSSQLRQSIVGCYVCLSPEQLQTQKYNEKVDIWSLGIICYEMLMGFSPFENQLFDIIQKKKTPNQLKLKFPQNCKLSKAARNFIKNCLSLNPTDRPSASQLLQDLFLNMPKQKTILNTRVQ